MHAPLPSYTRTARSSLWPAVALGVGLGGQLDGIVLHQVLQWHHMVSVAYPPGTLTNLEVNTLWDGGFHLFAWLATAVGALALWRAGPANGRRVAGGLLLGWGLFNLVEGVVDHLLLGIHHVNETAPAEQWLWWDLGFLAAALLLIAVGVGLAQGDERERTPVR